MKFTKEKLSRLTGETEVEYVCAFDDTAFKIIASGQGVRFEGETPYLTNILELSEFAKIIDDAFKSYRLLKPKIEHPGGFRVQ